MYETEYLKLKVAEENDFYNINENSDNLKKIDEKFKEMEDPDTPNSLAEQVGLIESPSFVNHDSDTIGNVPICPVNSTNPPDVGGGSVPSGWKKVSALKSGEKLFSIFEKISTIAYNVKWLFKWLNSINTIGEYTSVDSQGNIVRVKNSASDVETGVPFPFPIQTVVEGHELALRQLNTDTKLLKPTSGTYLCFFKAVDGARVVLFIPFPSPVEENKNYKLGDIRVWANNPMGTQGTFSLTGRCKNGLCFESSNSNVIYQFSVLLNDHMYPGTAELVITP